MRERQAALATSSRDTDSLHQVAGMRSLESATLDASVKGARCFYPRQMLLALSQGLPYWPVKLFGGSAHFSDAVKIRMLQQLFTRQSLSRIHVETALREQKKSPFLLL